MNVGDTLRKLRREKMITQKELAEQCGITDSAYSYFERGERTLSVEMAKKIADVLGVEWQMLFNTNCQKEPSSAVPIYAKTESTEVCREVKEIQALLREAERKMAFLSTKGPMLYAVPAPDNDLISIGRLTVCGVSALNEAERAKLTELLKSF